MANPLSLGNEGTGGGSRATARLSSLLDSDFDTEDEQYGDDIEEIISNRLETSVPTDEEDSDDLLAQVEALPDFSKKTKGKKDKNMFSFTPNSSEIQNQMTEKRNKKRKALA